MPRQNVLEIAAAVAAARLEGFQECRAMVARLSEAGLSLKVAEYALGEQEDMLVDALAEASLKAEASRAPAPKPAKRRKRQAPAEEPAAPAEGPPPADDGHGGALEDGLMAPLEDGVDAPFDPTALPAEWIPSEPPSDVDKIPF